MVSGKEEKLKEENNFSLKQIFLTGLILFLPIALTVIFVVFIFNLLTKPFTGVLEIFFIRYNIFEEGFWIFSADQLRTFVSQFLILIFLTAFIFFLGIIARGIFVNTFIKVSEHLLSRLPLVRGIYKTSKDLVSTILRTDSITFKRAVLVPFPDHNSYSIGLIAQDELADFKDEKRVVVYMPTAPLPSSGFVLIVKEKDLIYLDISVEDALKYIISCGVVSAPLKLMH